MAETQDSPRPDAISRFMEFLGENEIFCESNGTKNEKKFVCIDAVRAHLEARDCEKLLDILEALFDGADMPDHGTIISSHVAMLCILININKGAFITDFIRAGWSDDRLPQYSKSADETFPEANFYEQFWAAQWMFRVAHFTRNIDIKFKKDIILPITKKRLLGHGGSADIYEIQIHACCNKFYDDSQGNPRKMCYQKLVRDHLLLHAIRY